MSSSRNDIFSTSWQSADSPMPAPPPGDLARRRTTGPAWRRPRTIPPRVDEIFNPDSLLAQPPAPLGLHRGGSLREPPVLRLETTELTGYPTPQTSSTSSRTSSFFDVSPTSGLCPSTRSVSTSLTDSSTNPSLAASLPPTSPLAPVQLRFTPRPDLQLGQGRFSHVYLAAYREHQPKSDWRVCVVKRLEPDNDSRALGLREAWFLRQLSHDRASHPGQEFITRLLGVQVEDEKPVYAHARSASDSTADRISLSNRPRTLLLLEYYPLTLSALPAHHLCPRTFLTLATQLSQALAYCHSQHILHTDVKPANILLATYPSLSVRLADFGSSLHLPSLPTTPSDPVGLGTLAYSPPEFFRPPPSEFSFPADVFSAGVTLASALFNRAPYERIGIRECRRWVTRGAYWTYEEHKRAEGEMPVGDRLEDAELMSVGKESFERVLGRTCTPTELAGLIAPTGPSSTPTPPPPDVIPYSDGSAPVYFPHSPTRVPQDVIFLLKRMCEPIPEQRPTMDEVAHQFQALRLGL